MRAWILLMLTALFPFTRTEKCKLFDYCTTSGYCKNFTNLQLLSEAAEQCLKADNKSLFNYFTFKDLLPMHFVESNVLKIDSSFDIHLWKWIFYNQKLVSKRTSTYALTISNLEFGDLGKYSSNYTNLDMKGFELSQVTFEIARNTKQGHVTCDKSVGSWALFLKSVTQELEIESGKYFTHFCPYWLRDVELNSLVIFSNSELQFSRADDLVLSNFSSNIKHISLRGIKKLILDENLLNANIFRDLNSLELSEVSLASITPTNLFQSINKLNCLKFYVLNTRGFFHSVNGTQWMTYLNYHVHLDIALIMSKKLKDDTLHYISNNGMSIEIEARGSEYSLSPFNWYIFPEEDFCLFRDFPHKQLVVPVVRSYFTINCSCTLAWLLQYYFFFYQNYKFPFMDSSAIDYFTENFVCAPENSSQATFEETFYSCNMSHRLGLCSIQETPNTHDPYFDLYDLKNGLQTAHLYLLDYFGPIFSFVSSWTNLLIVIVLSHNKLTFKKAKKSTKAEKQILLLNERLYQLMFINAIVNLIYCLMYFLDFTIDCTPTPFYDYDYQNFLNFNRFTFDNCLVKDIVIGFIASTLKMISNTLLIFISLNRYVLIGKDHAEFIIKLSSISRRKLLISTGIVSCLLSVIIVFQYKTWSSHRTLISGSKNQTVLYIYDFYVDYYYNLLRDSNIQNHLAQLPVLITFSVIHDSFSYLFFCIIILILDVVTVKKFKETLTQKSAMTHTTDTQDTKHKAETKSIIMVCINSIVNFFLRLPEILSMICFIFFDVNPYVYKILCVMYSRCLTLYDLSNVAYILSLSTPLFFYLGFNNNFHSAFKVLKSTFSCKQKVAQSHNETNNQKFNK